ncbi:class I SAM-dependent methyltransferase [Micromonospora yangpuensis]|uniref:Methyltransferase domain-containing protein n=1 Tax=Micromonospora yangpuensis TaxID=683228 RepID=A0A1C6UUA9_9ACTN|nr:class I SAM-dependent methyltransferase [Micromonospora yangpuensis]GGM24300.1 hypothetical protein GCM10012279_48310 [Micromonospora yangpuensis]SCL57581.1 Methyltransferase domain-containing protein [Micromonospora yangpuensis]
MTAQEPASRSESTATLGRPSAPGTPPTADFAALRRYADRITGDLAAAMVSVACALGDRLGLFGALVRHGPCDSAELAAATGVDERYLREWLLCLAGADYLEVDRETGRYALPAPMAPLLTGGSPMDLSGGHALLLALAAAVDPVATAFTTGSGVAAQDYPKALYDAMERMSAGWLDAALVDQWIPAVAGLPERLRRGGTVVDLGSGGGHALIRIATAFPASRLVGLDLHPANVDRATESARRAGVADRVRFAAQDAADGLPADGVDLVTAFDVLHDTVDPLAVLTAARRALAADGAVLVLESRSAPVPLDNRGPVATILYATSALYCLPASRSARGDGAGTLGLPAGRIRELAEAAGLHRLREIPVASPFNALYELRP